MPARPQIAPVYRGHALQPAGAGHHDPRRLVADDRLPHDPLDEIDILHNLGIVRNRHAALSKNLGNTKRFDDGKFGNRRDDQSRQAFLPLSSPSLLKLHDGLWISKRGTVRLCTKLRGEKCVAHPLLGIFDQGDLCIGDQVAA